MAPLANAPLFSNFLSVYRRTVALELLEGTSSLTKQTGRTLFKRPIYQRFPCLFICSSLSVAEQICQPPTSACPSSYCSPVVLPKCLGFVNTTHTDHFDSKETILRFRALVAVPVLLSGRPLRTASRFFKRNGCTPFVFKAAKQAHRTRKVSTRFVL